MLEKTYNPHQLEPVHYKRWDQRGAFKAQLNGSRPSFTIMMPPPNVTGALHIGHALTYTLQDILIRYRRMQGYDALWQPGTDHAGISTQMVVERMLDKEGIKRQDLGREKFVERIWAWKEQSGGTIVQQMRRLGVSADWSRERFTLDEGLSHAVRKVFVDLYNEGLIFRDKRLVNWDPKLHTAISDVEVKMVETKGTFWYIKYAIEGKPNNYITIATRRPETLFGDVAVAVHPDDERFQHLIGKKAIVPLISRAVPIIADSYADPEKGSGAVKITPCHDINDFEVGKRHHLSHINIFDMDARCNENTPVEFQGLDRFKAREKVLEALESAGLIERTEEVISMIPYGDRSGEIIEPRLTDQWFVDAKTLAAPAIRAVEEGHTCFVPDQWAHTYYHWLKNIQPWCISRQLWWGHRIPAWYGPDHHIFVAMSEEEALEKAHIHYGKQVNLTQDEDVLDTWFSSALWPFSTLGWPDEKPELKTFYPTSVLVTGFDIIFFWVARMMMMGLHFMKDVPFRTVYMHTLVRDEKGQKMSKSKGNVIDPLETIEKYGADALRFSLASLAAPGRDINFSLSHVEGMRNFATKLWNAFRFCEMNACEWHKDFDPNACKEPVNRWIVNDVVQLTSALTKALDAFHFHEASQALYQFVWGRFCDWYLEFTKPILTGADEESKAETRATAAWALGHILHLMHPFMPFVSEELWVHLCKDQESLLITESWPHFENFPSDAEAQADMLWLIELITEIRSLRSAFNVSVAARIDLQVLQAGEHTHRRLVAYREIIERMSRTSIVKEGDSSAKESLQIVIGDETYVVPLAGVINLEEERQRLKLALKEIEDELHKLDQKLGNAEFMAKAPAAVIETNQQRRSEAILKQEQLTQALQRLQQ